MKHQICLPFLVPPSWVELDSWSGWTRSSKTPVGLKADQQQSDILSMGNHFVKGREEWKKMFYDVLLHPWAVLKFVIFKSPQSITKFQKYLPAVLERILQQHEYHHPQNVNSNLIKKNKNVLCEQALSIAFWVTVSVTDWQLPSFLPIKGRDNISRPNSHTHTHTHTHTHWSWKLHQHSDTCTDTNPQTRV